MTKTKAIVAAAIAAITVAIALLTEAKSILEQIFPFLS